MDISNRSIWASLVEFIANLRVQVRAALAVGIDQEPAGSEREQHVDPDFEGWLRSDPMVTGDAATEIARIAAETDADLIAVGVTRRGALSRKLFGGTAARVMRIAGQPVIAVPESPSRVRVREERDTGTLAA